MADTAPVAFGAIAIPITTLGQVSGLPRTTSARWSDARRRFWRCSIPFVLVFMVDGRRGLRETWPAALTAGLVFAVLQFAISNYISMQLTDIIAVARLRRCRGRAATDLDPARRRREGRRSPSRDRRRIDRPTPRWSGAKLRRRTDRRPPRE